MRHSSTIHALLLAGCLCAGGCGLPAFMTPPGQTRGNKVDEDAIKQLVPGTSTRADVTALIGSPTAHATFDDNKWIYVSEVTKPVIAGTEEVRSQTVYVLTFTQAGTLSDISKKGLKDSADVDIVSRVTPTPGSDAGFLQQLLGNIGKVAPVGLPGSGEQGKQGSSSNPGNF